MRDAVTENQPPVKGTNLILLDWHTLKRTNPRVQPIDGHPLPGCPQNHISGGIKPVSAIWVKLSLLTKSNGKHVVDSHRSAGEYKVRRLLAIARR
jgi:hypothetical protein